ncbi:MAG: VTT domain-containing protein [Candidatus Aenigmarchaeota archaeon]|nr:VTT domain-containing protein [Candidatus Aenigmarchaeota archaeon]
MIVEFTALVKYLLMNFSYLAVFFIGMVSTSTIFLPLPLDIAILLTVGLGLNPYLVGILAGVGAGIGEITGYLIGAGGRAIIKEKKRRPHGLLGVLHKTILKTTSKMFKKYCFYIIIVASFIPFTFDFVGILSGAVRYDVKKFLVAAIIGKVSKYLLITFVGSWIIGWIGI